MPVCPQCDNRHFNTKEALLQHMRSSSAWHPFCTSCDRRFVSQTAYDAHMAAKHPPTFDCTLCNRPYHAPFALEDHYRGSNVHPNCTKCGRGFRDQAACDEHRTMMHPKSTCGPCGGKVFYDDELQTHYWDSPNHPKCHTCSTGCKDEQNYLEHMSAAHPEQHCSVCLTTYETPELLQAHLWTSSLHPKCDRCNKGFANMEAKDVHLENVHTPKLAAPLPISPETIQPISEQKAETSTYGNGFSPLSSQTSPYGSTGFTPLSPRNPIQSLILGERRINSPDLRLELGFSSPIIDVKPPYSPAILPRPGVKIEELWNQTQNVQISPTRIPHVATPPRTVDSYVSNRIGYYRYQTTGSPSSSSWSDPAHSPPRSREIQPSAAATAARSFSPVRSADFHPRLYPGSVRAASLSRPGLLTEMNAASLPARALLRSDSDAVSVSGGTAYAFPQRRGTYAASVAGDVAPSAPPFAYGPGRYARSTSAESINWEELMGAGSFERLLPTGDAPSPTTAVCESPEPSPLTPAQAQVHLRVVPQSLVHSPSLATVSSPASSALGHSPIGSGAYEADTRPTTASSTPNHKLHGLMYTVTPSSECSSPMGPPDLSSPMSLKSLPSMSPLATTPIDIAGYDIPEAQRPLPDSPTEFQSPITVIDALPEPDAPLHAELQPDAPKLAPLLPRAASPESSVQSFITSPQEPEPEIEIEIEPNPVTDAPRASPAPTPPLPHELPTAELEAAFDLPIVVDERADATDGDAFRAELPDVVGPAVASPGSATPVASEHGAMGPSEVGAEGAPPKTSPANLNPLHCRACLADSCDDITASMCGHIFCNRCITDAVIRTSRCPVCMTPTLLYCLFRLDIAA
ncbi:hypothetical protein HYPSUDRAFT_35957 [Hypholoma sublateritium FD-334 SS-4]|uniref:RING-type domain-containing protein n=1 Tax=Hypholoma sublateritium (strain FD-334 SS-4) TaxID=945553 RepID=A0A0D2Q5G3_HYPSF|nr:hypothetical protein HYPSUDRAFT_35957 [Hypholoma sublateritium FD-334 SS-4]